MTRSFRGGMLTLVFLAGTALGSGQGIRPVRDDVGFCWNPKQVARLVKYLESVEHMKPHQSPIVAGISPHDDYLYAGVAYIPLMRAIHANEVVIFGVTHRTVRDSIGDPKGVIILDAYDAWRGAGERVPISPLREQIRTQMDPTMVRVSNEAHRLEHSIEALVPFVRYFNPSAKIVPIMVTIMSPGRMDTVSSALADVIAAYMKANRLKPGADIAFLISSDANHYGDDFHNTPFGVDSLAHDRATKQDVNLAVKDLTGTITADGIADLSASLQTILWCGRYSVPFGMLTTMKVMKSVTGKDLRGQLLRYADTYTDGVLPIKGTGMGTTAPFSLRHWVGFFSIAYSLR